MRRLTYLFITVLFISCNSSDSDTYKLDGNALGYTDGTEVLLFEIDDNNQSSIKDTLIITNGKFSASYAKSDVTALHLLKIGNSPNIMFFTENEDLRANIYKDSITSSFVTGGKQNELYVAYNKEMSKMLKKRLATNQAYKTAQAEQDGILVNELRQENIALASKERAFKRDFVKENGNSIFGLMLASELYQKKELTTAEVNNIIDGLGPKLASHNLVSDLKMVMEANKRAEIGGLAPQFAAPDPDGNTLSLKDAMGKYTIIDFWASWCRPCRMENPNVVRVYNKYHEKGLNIISVSLDKAGQKERWLKAIKDDQMDWHHVSNLKFWQDPIAKQYSVRSIPATFLLDEQGNIIDKNLRGPALEARIASLLD
ncbi:MAG: TlpA disulfide reductase family protein [Bacteroidota bacterium]